MFDDARFYSMLAQNSRSYGIVHSDDAYMYLRISALNFDDDLLSAMEEVDDYLID